jgi:hypothetical protein
MLKNACRSFVTDQFRNTAWYRAPASAEGSNLYKKELLEGSARQSMKFCMFFSITALRRFSITMFGLVGGS